MSFITQNWHKSKGAAFEDYFGVEVPSHYGNHEEEYWALRKTVGIRDVSYFGKLKIAGKDRQRFLNGMLTNEIKTLQPGQGTWALFLDVKGHIQADMKAYVFADHLLAILQHYLLEKTMSGLDRYIIGEDVRMKDVSADYAMFQVLGPEAESFLQSKGVHDLPADLYSFRTIRLGDQEIEVIRLGPGFAVLVKASSAIPVLEMLDAKLVGSKAFEIFRIESGLPLMRRDMDETNLPQEARLDAALSFQKGCYLGQEVMARIDAQGHVNRRLMALVAEREIQAGDKVFKAEREIGKVTSATRSLLMGRPVAMGYVRREFATPGEQVEIGNDHTTAIVRNFPL